VVAELRGWFDHFMKTGDDSRIPPNLLMTTYKTAVRHGGREEFEKMKQIQ
jgi:aminopeptidase 2